MYWGHGSYRGVGVHVYMASVSKFRGGVPKTVFRSLTTEDPPKKYAEPCSPQQKYNHAPKNDLHPLALKLCTPHLKQPMPQAISPLKPSSIRACIIRIGLCA